MSPHLHLFVWLSMTSAAVGAMDDNQYCTVRYRRLCQGKGQHVACQFPDEISKYPEFFTMFQNKAETIGPGSSCENYTAIKFSNDLKHFITHYINRRRQRIASGSERVRGGLRLLKPEVMMLVEWDRELAHLAQRLADQCHFVHDDCRATVRYPYAGQTVGEVRWRRSSESDALSAQRAVRRVFDAWWGERRRVHPKQLITPFRLTARGAVWGHFTQLAVWTLSAVGCGAVRHGANYPRLLLVCDFSHTNMLGQRTLTPGPLGPCPIHTGRRPRSAYPLLCGSVRRSSPTEELQDNKQYDEENDEDEEASDEEDDLTVEVGEVPTPFLWVRKSYKSTSDAGSREKEDGWRFRDATGTTKTKAQIIDRIEQELELKVITKPYSDVTYRQWTTRRYDMGKWRENQEESLPVEVKPLVVRKPYSVMEYELPNEYIRSTVFQEPYSRHRWKQTRDRPRRPGADALFSSSTAKVVRSRRPSAASLMMDKDDVDQLFRDTGFSMSWNKPN